MDAFFVTVAVVMYFAVLSFCLLMLLYWLISRHNINVVIQLAVCVVGGMLQGASAMALMEPSPKSILLIACLSSIYGYTIETILQAVFKNKAI